jgi:hypothetical protein
MHASLSAGTVTRRPLSDSDAAHPARDRKGMYEFGTQCCYLPVPSVTVYW